MHYFFEVSVPANTPQDNAIKQILPLTSGVITTVLIYIPRGHVGLTNLQIYYHTAQLYPLNQGGSYRGNETPIQFTEYQPITVDPCELEAVAWNSDDTYDHSFFIGLAVLRPEEMNQEIPATSISALEQLIGTTLQ